MSKPSTALKLRILAQLNRGPRTIEQLADELGSDEKYVAVTVSEMKNKDESIMELGRLPARKGPGIGVYALPGTSKDNMPAVTPGPMPEAPKRTRSGSGVIAGRRLIRGVIYPGGRSHRGGGL